MKKLLITIVLLVAVLTTWFFVRGQNPTTTDQPTSIAANDTDSSTSTKTTGGMSKIDGTESNGDDTDENGDAQGMVDQEDRPATDLYKTADDALKAVKEGAARYDDMVLQQFTQLGPDCSWCDPFYKSVRDTLFTDATLPSDQKSYFAELLAISGRVENINGLISAVEANPTGDNAELLREALEMTSGKDDVINYLGGKLSSVQDPSLKESIVAAVSNQGSALAVDTLYKATVDSHNPDGYYSQGTGLGEVIPDEEAFPALKQIVEKRDDYSNLGVKALLNSGVEGVKAVFDTLGNSGNPEQDQKILKDAMDHINYDEDTEKFLKDIGSKSKNPALAELAKTTLEGFAKEATTDDATVDTDQADAPAEDDAPGDN